MGVTFVRRCERFSIYRTHNGEPVYLAHGVPFTRYVVAFDRDEMVAAWGELGMSRDEFREFLWVTLDDPTVADEVRWCVVCGRIDLLEDGYTVENDEFACESCTEDRYTRCNDCDRYVRETYYTLNDGVVCRRCMNRDYSFCDNCDAYVYGGHEHDDGSGCCESPALEFTIRNDGDEPLANDTRVTVTLPAGVIDTEGIKRIAQYLSSLGHWEWAEAAEGLDAKWQTREGNFTKRLSRAVYKGCDAAKVPPDVLSQIGCIAREHSTAVDFAIETTRNLNMGADDFYHDDSCWWGSYYSSRCALKTNGGFGLRTFDGHGYVSGRAWVMPMRSAGDNLTPTFDTESPDAFVVFNGYGDLEGYTAARIVSHMAGWTYRKIGFLCEPMFVNGNTGYLVAPEDIAARYTDGSLNLRTDQHSSLYERETTARDTERELVNA